MEFLSTRRNRNRRKKRNLKKRRRERMKFEVRSVKKQRLTGSVNVNLNKKVTEDTMEADAFWKNYVAAQDWQKRHSISWWRSRCLALENENEILRNKIRSLIGSNNTQINNKRQQNTFCKQGKHSQQNYIQQESEEEEEEEEDLEFHVDEDMKIFLEQSLRHQMELKQKREQELAVNEEESVALLEGGPIWISERKENARLLYGDSAPTIMAMETALVATIERHKDKSKPQYWPNIPLRP